MSQEPQNKMKSKTNSGCFARHAQTFALSILIGGLAARALAQAPCPNVETFATGLVAPSTIIQTPRGDFIVAEAGPQAPNNGRVSIVDQQGNRRTLLEG